MPKFQARLAMSVCCLAMIGLILGTAPQSIILFLASGLALTYIIRTRKSDFSWALWASRPDEAKAFILFAAFLIWNVCSTLLNPANPNGLLLSYLVTGSAVILVPPLWAYCWRSQTRSPAFWSRLSTGLLIVWTLVAISQAIIGWQIEGSHMVFDPHFRRSRGFYSHPLTFAYVLLVIWPFFLLDALRNLRSGKAWFKLALIALMVMLSGSRAAQLLLILSLLVSVFRFLKGSQRGLALLLLGVLVAGVALSDNPISRRFLLLTSAQDPDRYSEYPDDRLAFWHAFSVMIEERPLLGHGLRLDKTYRLPYYRKIGLGSFKKPYEAHNQLIQILAEGGVIGLSLFAAWLFYLMRSLKMKDPHDQFLLVLTLSIFLIGGLTQNAFHDFEVRYALILMLSLARARTQLLPR